MWTINTNENAFINNYDGNSGNWTAALSPYMSKLPLCAACVLIKARLYKLHG